MEAAPDNTDDDPQEPLPDVPPWERPGAVRRDCDSHHGGDLVLAANVAFVLAFLSLPCCIIPLALLSFPLCVLVRGLAQRDLQRMEAGWMDPSGFVQTDAARRDAQMGILISGLSFVIAVGYFAALVIDAVSKYR